MRYIGLGVHLRSSHFCLLDERGGVVIQKRILGPSPVVVERLNREVTGPFTICYEASRGYGHLYDALTGLVALDYMHIPLCSGSRARRTSFSALRYWICLAKWVRLAVTNSRSNGLMKRVGIVGTFAHNSIWARQKTIYLYTALSPQAYGNQALAAAIRSALSEVGSAGLGWIRTSVSGQTGVTVP
jgi:hypothetical protein